MYQFVVAVVVLILTFLFGNDIWNAVGALDQAPVSSALADPIQGEIRIAERVLAQADIVTGNARQCLDQGIASLTILEADLLRLQSQLTTLEGSLTNKRNEIAEAQKALSQQGATCEDLRRQLNEMNWIQIDANKFHYRYVLHHMQKEKELEESNRNLGKTADIWDQTCNFHHSDRVNDKWETFITKYDRFLSKLDAYNAARQNLSKNQDTLNTKCEDFEYLRWRRVQKAEGIANLEERIASQTQLNSRLTTEHNEVYDIRQEIGRMLLELRNELQ